MSFSIQLGLFCWLVHWWGVVEMSPGTIIGYYSEDVIALPKLEMSSTSMTMSKCVTICGERAYYYVAIKGNWCRCGSKLKSSSIKWENNCLHPVPCPGDPNEVCGCDELMVYVNGEFRGQCKLMMFLGKKKQSGSYSDLTVQLFGDSGHCNEASVPYDTIISLSTNGFDSNCMDIGKVRSLRLSNVDPSDAYQISKVTVQVPSNPKAFRDIPRVVYEFNFGGWLGREGSVGSPFRAVDLYPNGSSYNRSYSYLEQDDGLYYKNFSIVDQRKMEYYCATNNGCKSNETFVQFQGFVFKQTIDLPQLIFYHRTGCFNPPSPISSNVTYDFQASGDGASTAPGTSVSYTCKKGVFLSNKAKKQSIKCNTVTGNWPPVNLLCVLNCSTPGPDISPGATSNMSQSLKNAFGTVVVFDCPTGVFAGTLVNHLTVQCLADGNWSVGRLPPCVPAPLRLPVPLHTSVLRPMSSFDMGRMTVNSSTLITAFN